MDCVFSLQITLIFLWCMLLARHRPAVDCDWKGNVDCILKGNVDYDLKGHVAAHLVIVRSVLLETKVSLKIMF